MLPRRQLIKALRNAPVIQYQGALCRAVRSATLYGFQNKFPYTPRPLYDLGPPAGGARFTPKRGAPALYLAEDYETSLREHLRIESHALPLLRPSVDDDAIVLFVAEVHLDAVLDLTNRGILAMLGTNTHELREPWRFRHDRRTPPTHVLGRAIADNGRIQAIRFRSTKGAGDCFMVLTGAIVPPAYVRVRDRSSNLVATLP